MSQYVYLYNNKPDLLIPTKRLDKISYLTTYIDPLILSSLNGLLETHKEFTLPAYTYEHRIDLEQFKGKTLKYIVKKNIDHTFSGGTDVSYLLNDIEEFKNKTFTLAMEEIKKNKHHYSRLLDFFVHVKLYCSTSHIVSSSATSLV